MAKTLLTAAAAKTSAEKASATIKAKTASEIRARAEEALEAAKTADAYKDEAETLVNFSEIAGKADASIAALAMQAFTAFTEADKAAEKAIASIAAADSSQGRLPYTFLECYPSKRRLSRTARVTAPMEPQRC